MLAGRPTGHESLGVVVPWSDRLFQYTVKDVARPLSGSISVTGTSYDATGWAVLDHGRGRWPYSLTWNWAAGLGSRRRRGPRSPARRQVDRGHRLDRERAAGRHPAAQAPRRGGLGVRRARLAAAVADPGGAARRHVHAVPRASRADQPAGGRVARPTSASATSPGGASTTTASGSRSTGWSAGPRRRTTAGETAPLRRTGSAARPAAGAAAPGPREVLVLDQHLVAWSRRPRYRGEVALAPGGQVADEPQVAPKAAPSRAVERTIASAEAESLPKNEKISPTKSPSHRPESAPAAATRPLVSRPVIRSTCLSSVPTIMQF